MLELTYHFYIKHETGFYDWVKKQDISKTNENLPEGVRFIELMKPVFGDVGKLQARFALNDIMLIDKIPLIAKNPGFFQELFSFMDNSRVVDAILIRKLL